MRTMQKGNLSKILWHPPTQGLQSLQILGKSIIDVSLHEAFEISVYLVFVSLYSAFP